MRNLLPLCVQPKALNHNLVRTFIVLSLATSVGCAFGRHKSVATDNPTENQKEITSESTASSAGNNAQPAENSAPTAPVTAEQKIESLSYNLSKAQARIEELEAKIAAMQDSLDGTKLAVENIAGPKNVPTLAIGEMSDDVKESPVTTSREQQTAHNKKITTKSSQAATSDLTGFVKAMNQYRAAAYGDSATGFRQFVENHPDHSLAGTAQFYVGESHFAMADYKQALLEYQKVLSAFSGSPRVPSALVRLSHCYRATGEESEAERFMQLAQKSFPGNPSLDWTAPVAANRTKQSTTTTTESAPQQNGDEDLDLRVAPMEMKTTDTN